ncbi:MAG: tetratricopeptide repeat protein [Bacteroidota bacterium]
MKLQSIILHLPLPFMLVIVSALASYGQSSRDHLKNGNKEYKNENFQESETSFRKSLELSGEDNYTGNYNLGNSLYRLKKNEEALKQYQNAANLAKDPEQKSKSYHNMGNTYMNMEKYQEAVNSYKQALRLNPQDEDTRYNLAYAQSKLVQQNQNQQNKQDQNKNKEKEDQNKQDKGENEKQNQQNQSKNQDQQGKNDKQDQNQGDNQKEKENNKNNQQAQNPSDRKMSKEEAERMLNALQNDEADLQKKMKRIEGKSAKTGKQW